MVIEIIKSSKIKLRIIRRFLEDFISGKKSRFANQNYEGVELKFSLTLGQEIKVTKLSENKIHNLKLAADKISKKIIKPNEIFSFWNLVGEPSSRNGFLKGRALINGKLTEQYGGGLCQLSGIIYHIALMAQLNVIERYNHTVDIYNNEERFTPLGADSTVVYGYKDLRIVNNLKFPIRFVFKISNTDLTVEILSEKQIDIEKINFEIVNVQDIKEVVTLNSKNQILCRSYYHIS